MSRVNWFFNLAQPGGNPERLYIYDITTAGGSTQMFLQSTNWMTGGNLITPAEADAVAAATKTAILANGGTACTQSLFTISNYPGVSLVGLFDVVNWQLWQVEAVLDPAHQLSGNPSCLHLATNSPADGKLSSGQVNTVAQSVNSAIVANVTGLSYSLLQQVTFSPATA